MAKCSRILLTLFVNFLTPFLLFCIFGTLGSNLRGKIIDVNFHKSIIHSIAALTYEQAQALIDEPDENSKEIKCGAVKRLASIARILRQKRIDAGASTLASTEGELKIFEGPINNI